jgi:hypothetical protein
MPTVPSIPLTNINPFPLLLCKITHTTQRYGIAAQPGRNPTMYRPITVIIFILLTLAALAEIGFLSFG